MGCDSDCLPAVLGLAAVIIVGNRGATVDYAEKSAVKQREFVMASRTMT